MRRLVVISSPPRSPADPERDGTTMAMHEALAGRGGLWIGAAEDGGSGELAYADIRGVTLATLDRPPGDVESMADAAAQLVEPNDLIWVRGEQYAALGEALHLRGVGNRVGYDVAGRSLPGAASWDVLAFPSAAARDTFLREALASKRGAPATDDTVTVAGRRVRAIVAPEGIDVAAFEKLARSDATKQTRERLWLGATGRVLIVGIDPLRAASGISERIAGFRRFLEASPDRLGLVSLLQIALPADGEPRLGPSLHREAGRVNAQYGDLDWTPLRLVPRAFDRATLAGVARAARVGLMTPLADGLTVPAKMFVAAQDPRDPAALIVADHPGATAQLRRALAVDPRDPQAIAAALARALAMGRDERVERWEETMHALRREDAGWQVDTILTALDR